jgi:hypothetical protein|tara:strand:- start:6686 stop:7207 length:522 start_codon:yes stop_codon:yes gene_type:complete
MPILGRNICKDHPDVEPKFSAEKDKRVCGECQGELTLIFEDPRHEELYNKWISQNMKTYTKLEDSSVISIYAKDDKVEADLEAEDLEVQTTKKKKSSSSKERIGKEKLKELGDKVVEFIKTEGNLTEIRRVYKVCGNIRKRIRKQDFGEFKRKPKKQKNTEEKNDKDQSSSGN